MDGGAWKAAVHGVAEGRTRLSDFTSTFHSHALEKEMATHSSVLAWRIPGTGEPGGLSSMGLHRVGHDWSDLAAAAAASPKCSRCSHFSVFQLLFPVPDVISPLPPTTPSEPPLPWRSPPLPVPHPQGGNRLLLWCSYYAPLVMALLLRGPIIKKIKNK